MAIYHLIVIFIIQLLLLEAFAGVFFIIPCVDIYEKIDMRTQTFDVPPQEVTFAIKRAVRDIFSMLFSDLDQGQRDSVCQRHLVLQGARTHICPPTQNLDISL